MKLLYLILLITLLGTFWLVLNKLKRNATGLTPILGWMVGLAYFILASLVILTLNGGFRFPDAYGLSGNWGEVDLSKPDFLRPYLLIWLSLMLTCAVANFSCPTRARRQTRNYVISRGKLERIILITMGLLVVEWIATVWMTGGIAEFLVSHWYTRLEPMAERFGGAFTLYARTSLVNQTLFTGAAALYTSLGLKNRNVRWKFTSLILVFFLLGMVMSGNRIFLALYILAFLTSCWLYGRKQIIATVLVASPVIVMTFSVWAWVRQDLSTIPDSVDTYVIDADVGNWAVTSLMDVTEGSAITLLIHMIGDFGNKYNYLYGSTYSRIFTFLLPRSVYPSRPPDFTTLAARLYEPGETTTLGATALGEAWANFGFIGIFVLPLFTLLVLAFSHRLNRMGKRHDLVAAVSFVMLIWFARTTFAENTLTLIGVLLLIWVLKLEKGLYLPTPVAETSVYAN